MLQYMIAGSPGEGGVMTSTNINMPMKHEGTMRQAFIAARDKEEVDAGTDQILQSALAGIWSRIQARPSEYVMTTIEFAVFNRYRACAEFQNETARNAIARYWNVKGAVGHPNIPAVKQPLSPSPTSMDIGSLTPKSYSLPAESIHPAKSAKLQNSGFTFVNQSDDWKSLENKRIVSSQQRHAIRSHVMRSVRHNESIVGKRRPTRQQDHEETYDGRTTYDVSQLPLLTSISSQHDSDVENLPPLPTSYSSEEILPHIPTPSWWPVAGLNSSTNLLPLDYSSASSKPGMITPTIFKRESTQGSDPVYSPLALPDPTMTNSTMFIRPPYPSYTLANMCAPVMLESSMQATALDRAFKCDQCPQSFNRNHDLKRHKRVHLAVKPFPCGHCEKSFSRKDALKRHILVKGCGHSKTNGLQQAEVDGTKSSTRTSDLDPDQSMVVNQPGIPEPKYRHGDVVRWHGEKCVVTEVMQEANDWQYFVQCEGVPLSMKAVQDSLSPYQNDTAEHTITLLSASSRSPCDDKEMKHHTSNSNKYDQWRGVVLSGYNSWDEKMSDASLPTTIKANQERSAMDHGFDDVDEHKVGLPNHLDARPEKCPFVTCEYHIKGFVRKYDKSRHVLTHYKGLIICDFCPASTPSQKNAFSRVDVFKQHLRSMHRVHLTPSDGQCLSSAATGGNFTVHSYKAAGKCSICSSVFSCAQDFCEHLDDCVLHVVSQAGSEAAESPDSAASDQHDSSNELAPEYQTVIKSERDEARERLGQSPLRAVKSFSPFSGSQMDCESFMDTDIDEFEDHQRNTLSPGLMDVRNSLVAGLLETFEVLQLDWQNTERIRCHAGTKRGRGGQASSTTSGTNGTSAKTNSASSGHESENKGDEEDSDQQDGRGDKRSKKSDSPATNAAGRLIACPYTRYDPIRYSERNREEKHYRGCLSAFITDIPKLKQHLYRVHRRPDHCCASCYGTFKTRELLEAHQRTRPACDVREPKYVERMTDDQLKEVKKKRTGLTTAENWKLIFRIIFTDVPEDKVPELPYVDSDPQQVISNYLSFFNRTAPAQLRTILHRNLSQTLMLDRLQLSILDAALETSVSELVRNLTTTPSDSSYTDDSPLQNHTALPASSPILTNRSTLQMSSPQQQEQFTRTTNPPNTIDLLQAYNHSNSWTPMTMGMSNATAPTFSDTDFENLNWLATALDEHPEPTHAEGEYVMIPRPNEITPMA